MTSKPFEINKDGTAFLPLSPEVTAKKLRQACKDSFQQLPQLRALWTQAKRSSTQLLAALEAGFAPATPLDGPNPVLILTPFALEGLKEIKDAVL